MKYIIFICVFAIFIYLFLKKKKQNAHLTTFSCPTKGKQVSVYFIL